MATHDYVIGGGDGLTVRNDINAVLQAIATNNFGALPLTTYPFQWRVNAAGDTLQLRNGADTLYMEIGSIEGDVFRPHVPVDGVVKVGVASTTTTTTTTSSSFQPTNLSLTFTPEYADSALLISVSGRFDAYRVAGSPNARYGFLRIWDDTANVSVNQNAVGQILAAVTSSPVFQFTAPLLRGLQFPASDVARTFRAEIASGDATNVQVEFPQSGQAIMTVMEVRQS